jgi:hypothetical protein
MLSKNRKKDARILGKTSAGAREMRSPLSAKCETKGYLHALTGKGIADTGHG